MVANPWGFVRHRRVDLQKRPIPERLRDWRVVLVEPEPEHVRTQALRCMDCGVAFCHAGCPLGNLIPEWNELSATGNWREGLERLHATNNFPEFTGWLCPAPCEPSCVLAIDDDPVTIKAIELALIERGWREGWVEPARSAPPTGKRAAVVGSGPGGLAAAQQLRRAGHDVVVYERDDRAGGLLRYGIPDFKIEKRTVDRRLAQLEAEGVRFRCSTSPSADELETYDAVVLAVGALKSRELPLPGRELSGVMQAMEYLPMGNRVQAGDYAEPPVSARGKRVLIIGGGDTASDCLGTANRQGAVSVHMLDHNPRPPEARVEEINPWPQWPKVHKRSPAHDEGVDEVWASEVCAFVDDGTWRVRGVQLRDVQRIYHPDRTREFVPVPGSDRVLAAELVLLAAGFVGTDSVDLCASLGVEIDGARGTVKVDDQWRTSNPKVYACGDAVRGASLIVWAIAEARAAAAAVDQALMGSTALPSVVVPYQPPL
ncbi:MAG: glutamate synthase subunit beta [Acidimicrobiales bacterium]